MHFFKRLGFTRLEGLLGLSVILAVTLAVVPLMRQSLHTDDMARAGQGAEIIARAVLDYNTETGDWPRNEAGQADLALLTQKKIMSAGTGSEMLVGSLVKAQDTLPQSLLDEIPLDPWDRPYSVFMLPEDALAGNPKRRSTNVTIVVLSAGENGTWDTGMDLIRQIHDAGLAMESEGFFDGDDLGFIMTRTGEHREL